MNALRWAGAIALACSAVGAGATEGGLGSATADAKRLGNDSTLVVHAAEIITAEQAKAIHAAAPKSVANLRTLSGAWFNAQQAGHGFSINFDANGTVAAAWYVFSGGQQVWLVGAGTFDQATNSVTMNMIRPLNGQFPPAFQSSQVTNQSWGTLNLRVNGCDSITATWDALVSGFSDSSLALTPVLRSGGDCGYTGSTGGGGNVTLVFENSLVYDVDVTIRAGDVVRVPARSTQSVARSGLSNLTATTTIRAFFANGSPVGEITNTSFAPIANPSGTITFDIDNQVGTQLIFAPFITNNGNATLLFGVNEGLQSQFRCNCTASPGLQNAAIGYYRYFSNSNVRGYNASRGYGIGQYVYWGTDPNGATQNFTIEAGSGLALLTTSLTP